MRRCATPDQRWDNVELSDNTECPARVDCVAFRNHHHTDCFRTVIRQEAEEAVFQGQQAGSGRRALFELRRGAAEFGEKSIDEARHNSSVLGVGAANCDQWGDPCKSSLGDELNKSSKALRIAVNLADTAGARSSRALS